MASNPQLPVEDQTDEDFFDKLVDDDFPGTESGSELAAADESDETKAFPSLSLGEVETRVDDWRGETKEEEEFGGSNVELVGHSAEGSNSLVPPNSTGIDDLIEPKNDVTNGIPDSTTDRGESLSSGVKEVQWSLFNTDATRSGGSGGFGSYSDLFNELEDTSRGFPEKVEENLTSETKMVSGSEEPKTGVMMTNSSNYEQYQGGQGYVADVHSIASVQDSSSNQYWENLYPGWKYDPNTGQWYQVDGFDSMTNVQDNFDANSAGTWAASDGKLEASYLQQTVQSVAGTVTDSSATGNVSSWNQVSQGSNDYPEHMVFDPQYPGWYYDTIAQEWRTLDAYNLSLLQAVQSEDQLSQNGFDSAGFYSQDQMYGECGQANNDGSQGRRTQHQDDSWSGSYTDYNLQTFNGWQPEKVHDRQAVPEFSRNQQVDSPYVSNVSVNCLVDQKRSFDSIGMNQLYDKTGWGNDNAGGNARSQSYIRGGGITQQYNQPKAEQNEQVHFSNNYYDSQKSGNHSQQPLHNSHQFSYTSDAGRSSAGRPPHALVTFGFGGKIILMKDSGSSQNASYGNQDPAGGSVSVLNLMEAVTEKMDAPSGGVGPCNYFRSLCQQSFPGPLVGGNVGSKELNKWIDERVANCESPGMDYRKGEVLRLLLSLLKISCQHYGKLRSPFGTDTTSRESENPESAVAKLFASANRHGGQFNAHGAIAHCLQNFPLEGHIQATAAEVQSLLVSGRTKEALLCAQDGQLWGPALVLAAQLGDRFYVDTVKQMALHQLTAGSPLRTLCLLIAGQHADVFSTDATTTKAYPAAANRPQQSGQLGGNVMLDDWEMNLAVITANRTKDDELVIIHLGDCLWKERSEIVAAHICYLIAEANFEPYSDSARLCLIGADHWKFPRTFSNPEAIQRTELYEYSKALGNSQFTLLPFQPYKLIYAHMLAEVGKVPDALKYCQAVLKSIKTSRAPEVETLKQSVLSLEERLKTHQQGGFTTNLAPAKLVGKLLNLFDSTAHRVVGGLPPVPPTSQSSVHGNGHFPQMMGPRVSASQSTMAMSSLMPSESMEPTSEWTADGSQKPRHNRSVSEPDFSRTPRQGDSPKGAASDAQGNKASNSSRSSRFVRFGFGSQFLQKTVGLVLKRSDRQAKLGEKNKFYYDEKLKRWVEEGAEPPAEEAALPPPPTTSAFQNGMSDYSLRKALKSEGSPTDRSPDSTKRNPMESSSGIPPIPPSSNQFSARGRAGVRSRYVDTFNQNTETSGSLFQSPSVPSLKSAGAASPKFFVPKPASSSAIETVNSLEENALESASTNENPSTSTINRSSHFSPPSSSMPMQRIPSMGTINGDVSVPPHSRRTASWSGSFPNALSLPKKEELKPLGEALGMPPSAFMPNNPPLMNGSNLGDELHEVEL